MSAPAIDQTRDDFTSKAPRLGFVGGFDGMRGIAVVTILITHIFPEGTVSFTASVDVFFVISAFLIVSLLMQERRQNGRIDLRRFYARRALRLLPNSYACMLAWMLIWGLVKLSGASLAADGAEQVNAIPGNVAAAATYTYHLVYPAGNTSGPLVQFWSLALEEQFYLFVGVGAVLLLAVKRRIWVAAGVLVALVVWIGIARWRSDLGPWPGREYLLDPWTRGLRLLWLSRPDALLVGVLLALLNARLPDPLSPRVKRAIVVTGTIGAFIWAIVLMSSLDILHKRGFGLWVPGIPHDPIPINRNGEMWCALKPGAEFRPCTDDPWFYRWGYSLMALAVAPLTLCMARCKDSWVSRAFSFRWFRKVGEMSYSLYVWHILAYVLAGIAVEGAPAAPAAFVKILAAFGIAWLAHRYIDQAMLGMKLRFSSETMVLDRRTGEEIDSTAVRAERERAKRKK